MELLNFEGERAATGRPSDYPAVLLKLYIYGYLNRVQSSGRLDPSAGGHLAKRITDRAADPHRPRHRLDHPR
jgi:hypothetical protein